MYLTNDLGSSDSSNIIVEINGVNILMHVRENYANGSVKQEARILMDRHLVTQLIDYLVTNKPDMLTHTELWAQRKDSGK